MSPRKKPASQVDPETETVNTVDSPADAADDSAHDLPDPQGAAPNITELQCSEYPGLLAFTPHGKARFEDGSWTPEEGNEQHQKIARHLAVSLEEVEAIEEEED